MNAIELFTGCGGLAYGLCAAGLKPVKMVEENRSALATIDANKRLGVKHVKDWPAELGDVCHIDWSQWNGRVPIVAGGPPCQPFSQAGRAQGARDRRDMWPEAIRAVREIRPEAFLFENVRGLMRKSFANYFANLLKNLADADEAEGYFVLHGMVDAADYGAAQRRHRVIVAGFRRDVVTWVEFPSPTHSRERLLWEQWVTGEYWRQHGIGVPGDYRIARDDLGIVTRLRTSGTVPEGARWRTVRDVLTGLGEPTGRDGHVERPGARSYPGHTGSDPDQPSKALKAGIHGVPGGENMMRLPNGGVRYFTIREMARLQGLPDEFTFPGTWTETTRQLGNAVPVPLGQAFADWLRATLLVANSCLAA